MEIMEPPKSLISASANISVGVGVEKPISDSSLNVNINMETASDDLCPNSNLEAGTAVSAPDLFLTEAFKNADVDGDGKLSYEELKGLLQSLGLEEDELKLNEFVRAVDKDSDGTIDLVEFQSIIDKLSTKASSFEQHLREMFELYDDDGSGDIDQHEIRSLMAQLGIDLTDEELFFMIAEADADGDGDIDYEEFVALFKGIKVSGEEKKKNQQQQKRVVLQRKDSITGGIFDDLRRRQAADVVHKHLALYHMVVQREENDSPCLLSFCSNYAHFALIKFQQQENAVPEGAPRYWAKRLVPPIEFGSMHAILFQMALIPFTMSRYTIATFSNSRLNKYLPLDKALRIHIHLGYTMVSIVFSATIVFFIFFGLSCAEGEEAFCAKFTSEIMITGYCILGLLTNLICFVFYLPLKLLMAGTAFFRHSIPYEVFYGVHFLFLAMYAIAVGEYVVHDDSTFSSPSFRVSHRHRYFYYNYSTYD
eukprot:scaffold224_cov108-Skeletonema_marinoi.AAC.22